MKRKTFYGESYVDCEYDIEFSDILKLIETCNNEEILEIKEALNIEGDIICKTLYDNEKYRIIKNAFEKYSLEELQQKLA